MLAAIAVVGIAAEDAAGCVCTKSDLGLEDSHAVFVGRATGSRSIDAESGTVYSFHVTSAFKGVKSRAISVRSDDVCHAYFESGTEYIVYASREDGFQLATDRCYRNVELLNESGEVSEEALDQLDELNRLAGPAWTPPKRE